MLYRGRLMSNESHSFIWPVLFLAAVAIGICVGGHLLTRDSVHQQVAGRSDCPQQKEERQARQADWGWNVFNNGGGSPIYRL